MRDEVRDLLRDLCASTGAAAAAIAPSEAAEAEGRAPVSLSAHVGGGSVLIVWFDAAEEPPDPNGRAAALERTARAIRSCARRWEMLDLPPQAYPERGRTSPARAHERIHAYLAALVGSLTMKSAVVTRRGAVVASAGTIGELERERIPFTVRRVQAEADRKRGKSSHAEMSGVDFYAVSFWYDACVVCFFDGPFALDFVRHRARQVTRELSHLMTMLDDPDLDPVQVAPPPE